MSVLLHRFGTFIARHRRNRLLRRLAGACRRYLAWHENLDYELSSNGEDFVLETLGRLGPRVIFDAGANVGDWSLAARRRCPMAQIFCFEIAPPTFESLVARTAGMQNVHCENLGLSDIEGSIVINHFESAPALTTATAYPHRLDSVELTAQVVRGDAYAAARGIDHIDMLKIDVEGMEDRVLRGFEGMLSRRAIDLVQFEYGRVNILSHFLLADFHDYFGRRGYVVGKVFPSYVDFRPYDLADENFLGPNYLACREELTDYLRALGAAGS